MKHMTRLINVIMIGYIGEVMKVNMPVASCDPKDDSVCVVCDSYAANSSLLPQSFTHLKEYMQNIT